MNRFIVAAAVAVLAPCQASLASDHSARSVVGVWSLEVTLRVCATGEPIPGVDPFSTQNTFHQGGTMTEFGTRFAPATRNVGQGVWKKVGRSTYASRFVFHRFDASGLYMGDQDVRRISRLSQDGHWMAATARVELTDANGVVVLRGCATEEGPRLEL